MVATQRVCDRQWPLSCLLVVAACAPPPLAPPVGPVTMLQWNIANVAAGGDGDRVVAFLNAQAADVVVLAECGNCESLLPFALGYQSITGRDADNDIWYRTDRWELTADWRVELGHNDDGWGPRDVLLATLRERDAASGSHGLGVVATHWCVPIRAADDACDEARHAVYASTLIEAVVDLSTAAPAVLVGGDFNTFNGFGQAAAIESLRAAGFVDLAYAAGISERATFVGNAWAPAGQIDFSFAIAPVAVSRSDVVSDWPAAAPSDHYPTISDVHW